MKRVPACAPLVVLLLAGSASAQLSRQVGGGAGVFQAGESAPPASPAAVTTAMLSNATAATGEIYFSDPVNFPVAGHISLNCLGMAANIKAVAEPLDVNGLSWDAPVLTCSGNGNGQGSFAITANTPMRVVLYNGIPVHPSSNVGNGSIGYYPQGPSLPDADYPYFINSSSAPFGNYTITLTSGTTFTETDPAGAAVAGTGTVGTPFTPTLGVGVLLSQGVIPWASGDQVIVPMTAPVSNVSVSITDTPS